MSSQQQSCKMNMVSKMTYRCYYDKHCNRPGCNLFHPSTVDGTTPAISREHRQYKSQDNRRHNIQYRSSNNNRNIDGNWRVKSVTIAMTPANSTKSTVFIQSSAASTVSNQQKLETLHTKLDEERKSGCKSKIVQLPPSKPIKCDVVSNTVVSNTVAPTMTPMAPTIVSAAPAPIMASNTNVMHSNDAWSDDEDQPVKTSNDADQPTITGNVCLDNIRFECNELWDDES